MSKLKLARDIVAQNPGVDRKGLVSMLMANLSLSKVTATTYAYDLTRGQINQPKVSKMATAMAHVAMKTVKSVPEFTQTREERLELMRSVSRRNAELEAETMKHRREEMQAEVDECVAEAQQYVREHAPAFLRKELGLQ